MRDISRLNAEVQLLQGVFGPERVWWSPDYRWIYIDGFQLPPNLNQRETEVLIFVPENYGYGQPYQYLFVAPALKVWHQGRLREFPHYFKRFPYRGMEEARVQELLDKGWTYLCVHQKKWDPNSNVLTFLEQARLLLSDPFRDWE